MFGIGLPELILILVVALLVVGPKKLPELARSVGKALHDMKSMTEDVKQSLTTDIDLESDPNEAPKAAETGGSEHDGQKKDNTEPGNAGHSPEKIKSDPYGDLRG
jgi:sec-independent protein translocase protein TatA